MHVSRRSRLAISTAVLVVGVIGAVGAAQGAPGPGQYELRPEAGQEIDRDVPSVPSQSDATRFVPGQEVPTARFNSGLFGFTGVTFKEHRDADNGNQTSDTPPDQGLCVGSGEVIEPVNTTFSTYSTVGPARTARRR